MPNSSIVEEMKEKVKKELLNDELILKVLDAPYEDASDLINKNIFTYAQSPDIIVESGTYITIQVHIPRKTDPFEERTWVHPILELWVISHNKHMRMDNIPRVRANRNDFLAQLLDEKFNGSTKFGYGQMWLERNIEGVHPDNNDYLYRQLVFVTSDFNKKMCR